MVRPFSLCRPLIAAALVVGLGAAAHAQTTPQPLRKGEGPRLTEAQKQKVFPETRSLAVQDHQARIAILQQGERCLAAAPNGDALRSCMRQERQAIEVQRQKHREALRQVFQRNGIPVPDWSKRQGGRFAPPSAGSYGWDHPVQPGQPGQPLPLPVR